MDYFIIELQLIEGKTFQVNLEDSKMNCEYMLTALMFFQMETTLVCQINHELEMLNNMSGNTRDQARKVEETYKNLFLVRSILRDVKQLYCLGI